MIRFSASLVVVGVVLLIAGGVSSKLLLIYIAIGVSAVALLFLILGAIVNRAELFGREPEGIAEGIASGQASHDGYADEVGQKSEPVATAVAASRSPHREQSREPREQVAPAPDRPREADFRRQAEVGFAGYEKFARQAERRQSGPSRGEPAARPGPSQPQQPFVDPEPTRMDWAADLREAERQERQRRERERPERGRPERERPPERERASQPSAPFVDPNPTRMDWSAGLREAEKQERPQPVTPPQPVAATRAERIQQPAEATRAERILPPEKKPDKPETEPDKQDEAASLGAAQASPAQEPTQNPSLPTADTGAADRVKSEAEPKAAAPANSGEKNAGADDAQPDADSALAPTDTKITDTGTADTGTADTETTEVTTTDAGSGSGADDGATDDQDVTVVPGVPRYHRSECILIRFMGQADLQKMPVEDARKAGCTPCRACQPDGEESDAPAEP